jgi:hypothetical protein
MKLATVYEAIDRIVSGAVVDSEETEYLEFKQDPATVPAPIFDNTKPPLPVVMHTHQHIDTRLLIIEFRQAWTSTRTPQTCQHRAEQR